MIRQCKAGEMDFKVEGLLAHWIVLSATMVIRQAKFLNFRRWRMAKTVTFSSWSQSFNSFSFETASFFLCFPFFLFAAQKGVCLSVCGWVGWVHGCMAPRSPPPPVVAGPAVPSKNTDQYHIAIWFYLVLIQSLEIKRLWIEHLESLSRHLLATKIFTYIPNACIFFITKSKEK